MNPVTLSSIKSIFSFLPSVFKYIIWFDYYKVNSQMIMHQINQGFGAFGSG